MSGACECVDSPVRFVVKTVELYGNNEFNRGFSYSISTQLTTIINMLYCKGQSWQ